MIATQEKQKYRPRLLNVFSLWRKSFHYRLTMLLRSFASDAGRDSDASDMETTYGHRN